MFTVVKNEDFGVSEREFEMAARSIRRSMCREESKYCDILSRDYA